MPGSNELGGFLRARRARLRPGDAGLPPGSGARRTPGLRREEVAALAGLSIDYYIRLEQGKESNPSGPILDGLARALRLNEEEHAHLYALANHAAGRTARPVSRASRVVRPGIRQLLETVRPCPAYVLTRTSDLLAANPEALILFAGPVIFCDFWSYTRIFFWLPLAIWMIGLRRGLTWPAWCLLPAALWPLAGALRYV